jgi:hypothetical protein
MSESLTALANGGGVDLVDAMAGTAAIAAHIGKTQNQTAYMLEKGQLPAFKLGGKWYMRRSTFDAFIAKLEAAAIARVTEAAIT